MRNMFEKQFNLMRWSFSFWHIPRCAFLSVMDAAARVPVIDRLPDSGYITVCPVCGVGRSDSFSPCFHDSTALRKCAA